MCDTCRLVEQHITNELVALTVEREVVLAEAEAGLNVPDGRRPLFDHEIKAGVRFGDINNTYTHAEKLASKHIRDTVNELADLIIAFVALPVPPHVLAGTVAGLMVDPPDIIQTTVKKLANQLTSVLDTVYVKGVETVTAEAVYQGVLDKLTPSTVKVTPPAVLTQARADMVAASVLNAVMQKASQTPANKTMVRVDDMRDMILDHAYKASVDMTRQATHEALGAGRHMGVKIVDIPVAQIYAGELLDGATCTKCATIDGYKFKDEKQAEQYYPNGGPMLYCDGGNRCRGTLVYLWDTTGIADMEKVEAELPAT